MKNKFEHFIENWSYSYNKEMVFDTYQRMRVEGKSWAGTSHMGNIHQAEGNYSEEIKFIKWYWTRFHRKKEKIGFIVFCNIGNAFVKIVK